MLEFIRNFQGSICHFSLTAGKFLQQTKKAATMHKILVRAIDHLNYAAKRQATTKGLKVRDYENNRGYQYNSRI